RDLSRLISRCLRKEVNRRTQHIGDVKLALEDLKEESESGQLATASTQARRTTPRWLAPALVAAVAIAAAGWFWPRGPATPSSEAAPVTTPLTSYPGDERTPTFSPDGNQVAFSWNGEAQDNFDIYVKMTGAGRPHRLTDDPATDYSPAWSPDGRSIAFLRELGDGNSAVLLVPPLGGHERKVAEVLVGASRRLGIRSQRLAWHPGGEHLAVVEKGSPNEPDALFGLSIETGENR
ncbi:MAG: hypothetical protein GY953_27575, partial [bacterium]|nr:hypothetical protein [bacterium]